MSKLQSKSASAELSFHLLASHLELFLKDCLVVGNNVCVPGKGWGVVGYRAALLSIAAKETERSLSHT